MLIKLKLGVKGEGLGEEMKILFLVTASLSYITAYIAVSRPTQLPRGKLPYVNTILGLQKVLEYSK